MIPSDFDLEFHIHLGFHFLLLLSFSGVICSSPVFELFEDFHKAIIIVIVVDMMHFSHFAW